MIKQEYKVQLGEHEIVAEFSNLVDQAHGAVIMRSGDTVVLATACMSANGDGNPGFFNLQVEYQEKFYASGEILGSRFMRREGRPSETAILACRIIDRTLRPLFSHHIKNSIQIVVTVLSVGSFDPVILGVNAASLALAVSDIPWNGPVGAVALRRPVGEKDITLNRYVRSTEESVLEYAYDFDLLVCAKQGRITMIESMACQVSEEVMAQGFTDAISAITTLEQFQKDIISKIGKEKRVIPLPVVPTELVDVFHKTVKEILWNHLVSGTADKKVFHEVEETYRNALREQYADRDDIFAQAHHYYEITVDAMVHELALAHGKRADGRTLDQVRDLYAQAGGLSPLLHGTGIFYRGETHVLSVLTLGGPEDAYTMDGMETKGTKRFMHHYNFPPFSVGETGRFGGLNRREIGHGALAEKALVSVIPSKEVFPYTIRVVSECMASNGSTSQASVCASTLALMDGGVPLLAPVAGISVGLMLDINDVSRYSLLTDIQGAEDHYGDMDFKVAGTDQGITAIQLDIKLDGIPVNILVDALGSAKKARLHILDTLQKTILSPRSDISPYAPKIVSLRIDPSQIGMVIGSGGKTINEIREKTGAEITIEDDGLVYCVGKNGAAEMARDMIASMTKEWTVGETAQGTVRKVLEIGAIVSLSPSADGLVHVSEIAPFRIEKVSDYLTEGQIVPVTVVAVDKERDRISLSIKKDNPEFIVQKK
jgi:polyribonucleotide nucleotidyltransferase